MTDDSLAASLLDASPDGLLLVDAAGVVLLANRSATRVFGHDVKSLVGRTIEDLVPDEHRDAHVRHRGQYASEPTRRPMGTDLHLFAQHADGTLVPVEISLSPVTLDGSVHTIATVRDVSVRQEELARLALSQDRERIAHDLHDMVIQRLFAAGMSLQAIAGTLDSAHATARVLQVTEELDDTIHQLRNAIFELGLPDVEQSLSAHITAVVDERSRHLGFSPQLRVIGDLDTVPEHLGEQLVATVVEALSNVARHANATLAEVDVVVDEGTLRLMVRDNGVGMSGTPKPLGGVSNMMWRAAELGGTCAVAPAQPSGTELTWHVPV